MAAEAPSGEILVLVERPVACDLWEMARLLADALSADVRVLYFAGAPPGVSGSAKRLYCEYCAHSMEDHIRYQVARYLSPYDATIEEVKGDPVKHVRRRTRKGNGVVVMARIGRGRLAGRLWQRIEAASGWPVVTVPPMCICLRG